MQHLYVCVFSNGIVKVGLDADKVVVWMRELKKIPETSN